MSRLFGASLFVCGLFLFDAAAHAADNCPAPKNGGGGFIVERGERSKTEVYHLDDNVVKTVFRYGGSMALETTEFAGLFQLDRIDRGRQTKLRPLAPLDKLLPLKLKKEISANFEAVEAGGR